MGVQSTPTTLVQSLIHVSKQATLSADNAPAKKGYFFWSHEEFSIAN